VGRHNKKIMRIGDLFVRETLKFLYKEIISKLKFEVRNDLSLRRSRIEQDSHRKLELQSLR
jgi:hypothetical protein